MEAPESRAEPEAQLFSCPVRRRYAWQVVRYGRGVRSARRELLAADRGDEAAGTRALESLRALLVAAETRTGWYPEAFARAGVTVRDLREPGDLAHFPPLPRAALQERFHDLFSRRVRPFDVDEGWLGRSSGSTGEPVRFFMDGGSIHFFSAFLRFLWERFSLGPFPGPRRTAVVLLCTLPRSSVYSVRLPLLGGGLFRKLHFAEDDALKELERLAPAIVTGDPDSLGRLQTELAAGRVRIVPRLVVSSAFALPSGTAAGLAAATGARVVDSYSLAETGPVGWSCAPGSGRFHLLTPAAVLEEVEGELLLTNLRNRLFPLIRYRTGDLGVVLPEPGGDARCACGARGPVLARLLGRVVSRFATEDGRRVDPSQLQPLVTRLGVRQFQLLQPAAGRLVLRYTPGGEASDRALPEATRLELVAAARRLLGDGTSVSFERVAEPLFRPGEKPIVYRSDVPPSPGAGGAETAAPPAPS